MMRQFLWYLCETSRQECKGKIATVKNVFSVNELIAFDNTLYANYVDFQVDLVIIIIFSSDLNALEKNTTYLLTR